MSDESLVEWAASWVPDDPSGQRARFAEALRSELRQRAPKPSEFCANCPFAKHMHYEEDGKLVAPGCVGFAAAP